MAITLHIWTPADKKALMALCNAVDRTFLSDRLPNPYTEADADWWLGMVAGNEDMIKESHTRLIAGNIPGAKLAIIPGNHFIANKEPEPFNEAVLRFLMK